MYQDDLDAPGFKAIPVSGHWVRFKIRGQAVTVARIFWPRQRR